MFPFRRGFSISLSNFQTPLHYPNYVFLFLFTLSLYCTYGHSHSLYLSLFRGAGSRRSLRPPVVPFSYLFFRGMSVFIQ